MMAASEDRSITLPAERASVKLARDFVARAVADHVDDPAEVLLMTSELVSNVVGHVGSAVTITVRDGPVVRIEVHNHQAATEAFRDLLHDGRGRWRAGRRRVEHGNRDRSITPAKNVVGATPPPSAPGVSRVGDSLTWSLT